MKRNAWLAAVGLMGVAACSHHNDATTAKAGTNPRQQTVATTTTTTTTTSTDLTESGTPVADRDTMMNSGSPIVPAQVVRGETPSVKAMRQAVATLMSNDSLSQAELTGALNAIATALVDVPEANTGVGAQRMRANVAAISASGISDERTPLRVHAALVQALEALRTVENTAKADVVEMAVADLRSVNENKPINAQTGSVRNAICSVGNAVAIAYDTKELACGGATASAK